MSARLTDHRSYAEPRTSPAGDVDVAALEADLRAAVRGEVRFDGGARALYSTDSSNYRQIPIGVVLPRDAEDVVRAVAVCRRHGAPITARGGGTSLSGQTCNVAVVFDFSRHMHRILRLDPERRLAVVQPGLVLDDLRAAAGRHGLTFGPDPSTHNRCTLGGMIGNNSCGVHAQMAGRTSEQVLELEVLTYDGLRLRVGPTTDEEYRRRAAKGGREGQVYRMLRALRDRHEERIRHGFPDFLRWVSGYNLPALLPEKGFDVARALVGTEGTCVLVLEATVRLIPNPKVRSLLVLGYPSIDRAGDDVPRVVEAHPLGLEAVDGKLVHLMKQKGLHPGAAQDLPQGDGWLLAEFGGATKEEADAPARALMERLRREGRAPSMKLLDDPVQEHELWLVRESGLGATARIPGRPDAWEGWEDSSVPPDRLGSYLRGLLQLYDKYGYDASLYGHFGMGCVHTRINFDLTTAPGVAKFRAFLDEAARLVVRHGGSLSGEHGDGQSKAELERLMYGPELVQAFAEFKAIWDPQDRMNPGKVVRPFRITQNLRLGPEYRPWDPPTHFRYPSDEGSFARAQLRCVGVGLCRREGSSEAQGDVMCPSYMVTREEQHSTRGRARLLFEMLEGDVLHDGWRSEEVREALDLCLACKGCKGDCPMHVDMATYKAEFLAHYYEHRLRPRSAYALGHIDRWARLASRAPRLVNWATHAPGLSRAAKWAAGMAPERDIPRFAKPTFRRWFLQGARADRTRGPQGSPRVLLWPDTFTNYFHPEVGQAAVEVLAAAGFQVALPDRVLCCGRPLYDYGFLDRAKRLLEGVLVALQDDLAAGTPVVGLEPSCTAVFRDELHNLFPNDQDARRLGQQTKTLAEFLQQEAREFDVPRLERKALVQRHCHHQAVMKFDAEADLLKRMRLDAELLASGCCGMAGSFGFEATHYGVSQACGERVLLPRVREADDDVLLLADGFSCRTQIEQATGRRALHVAEALQLALREAQRRTPPAEASARGEPASHEASLSRKPR